MFTCPWWILLCKQLHGSFLDGERIAVHHNRVWQRVAEMDSEYLRCALGACDERRDASAKYYYSNDVRLSLSCALWKCVNFGACPDECEPWQLSGDAGDAGNSLINYDSNGKICPD